MKVVLMELIFQTDCSTYIVNMINILYYAAVIVVERICYIMYLLGFDFEFKTSI